MSPARHLPDSPNELALEIARRRAARRKAPLAVAVAAVAFGAAVAAATEADAATPGYTTTAAGGHAHALAAGPDDPSASASADASASPTVAGPLNALNLAGRGADPRRGQGGTGSAERDQAGNGQNRDGQNRDGQNRDGQNRDGQNRDGQNRDGQNRDGQNRDGQNQNGRNGRNDQDEENEDAAENTNGLDVLARDCGRSRLPEHTGFQIAPACVDTAFGEVADAEKGPSLLITDSPREAQVGESFTLKVSTRNLVRDRFLGAAAGGYYLESSVLTNGGLQRGHFHTACRMLESTDEAPESGASPAFFTATQDNAGGSEPDEVSITVPGLPERGTAQCTSWAGEGSHRVPMMQRADQTPAIDSVRITVN